jgi:peptide-methionine (R)-S-oxide reductase
MQRRRFLMMGLGIAGFAGLSFMGVRMGRAEDERPTNVPLAKSQSEWKTQLTPEQYHVMREAGTEAPHSSELNREHRNGVYVCAACGQPLFYSGTKFDAGCGWPSFDQAIAGSVKTQKDYKLIVPRVEYHCANCGSPLGHIFDDGPTETGMRYCQNGIALRFVLEGTPEYNEIIKKYPPRK